MDNLRDAAMSEMHLQITLIAIYIQCLLYHIKQLIGSYTLKCSYVCTGPQRLAYLADSSLGSFLLLWWFASCNEAGWDLADFYRIEEHT